MEREGSAAEERLRPPPCREGRPCHEIRDENSHIFNLPFGHRVRLFAQCGLNIVDLIETRPPQGVAETTYRTEAQLAWARRWPSEMIWVLDRT